MLAGGRRGDKQSTASRCRISCRRGFHSLVDALVVVRFPTPNLKSGPGILTTYFFGTLRTSALQCNHLDDKGQAGDQLLPDDPLGADLDF